MGASNFEGQKNEREREKKKKRRRKEEEGDLGLYPNEVQLVKTNCPYIGESSSK